MASAYSRPTEYAAPTPTKDVNLINEVLAAKQQRFDVNTARIEEAVSAVSNADLLREPEKEKLKERLSTLLNQVGQGSKLDLTDNNTARQIQGSVSSVIDDDLLKHIGLARQDKAFRQRITKLREEEPEKFNEKNLQASYYYAGYADYMKGDADSFGQLQYTPDYDLNENLNKPLESYGKSLGMVKDIDEDGNETMIATRKTDEFAAEKIENFLALRMKQDPRLRKQVEINALAEVGFNMKSAKQGLLTVRDSKIEKFEEKKSRINAQLSEIKDASLRETLESQKERLNRGIKLLKNQTFETDSSIEAAVTEMYADDLTDLYVDTYAKKDITDIKYTKKSKFISNAVSGNTNSSSPGQVQVGTRATIEQQKTDEEREELTIDKQEQHTQESWVGVNDVLEKYYPNEYKNKSDKEKQDFIKAKKEIIEKGQFNIDAPDGMNKEVYDKLKYAIEQEKKLEKIDTTLDERFTPKIESLYKAILKADKDKLKINNLARTMPTTVAMVLKNKTYSEMTEAERKFVNSEMALSIAEREGGGISTYAERYAKKQTEGLDFKKAFGEKLGGYLEKQREDIEKTNDAGLITGFGKAIGSYIVGAKNIIDLGATLGNPFLRKKAKARSLAEDVFELTDAKRGIGEGLEEGLSSGSGQFLFNRAKYFAGLQDKNIDDLDLDDVWGRKEYDDLFGSRFQEELKTAIKIPQEEFEENAIEQTAIVYSGNTDQSEQIRSTLSDVLTAKAIGEVSMQGEGNVFVPVKNSPITIMKGDNQATFNIGYNAVRKIDRDDKSELTDTEWKVVPVTIKDLEKNPVLRELGSIVTKRLNEWEFAADNPNEFEETIGHTLPTDAQEAYELKNTFIKRFNGSLSENAQAAILEGSVFSTTQDLLNEANRRIEDTDQLNSYYSNELSNEYRIKYTRKAGRFIPTLYKKPKGDKNAKYKVEELNVGSKAFRQNFDIYDYSLITSKLINEHLMNQMSKYR